MEVKSESFIVDFSTHMWSVRPRVLWQKLFDLYRDNGCPLEHMDNILIDFQYCLEAFNEMLDKDAINFLWGLYPGHYQTTWVKEKSWSEIGVDDFVSMSNFDFFVLCQLTKEKAVLTIKTKR
jgi:hypothetical protein